MSHVGEVGIMVHPKHQNRGVGTALLKACVHVSRKRGFRRLEADTLAHNTAMMRIAEKAGFTLEGIRRGRFKRDNTYLDEAMLAINFKRYALVREDYSLKILK